jgi:hypothetical protein
MLADGIKILLYISASSSMVEEFINTLAIVISILAGLGGLAAYIQNALGSVKKRADEKADDKAKMLKEQTDERARQIKEDVERTAILMKEYNERTAEALKKVTTDTAISLADYNTRVEEKLMVKIDKVDEKQSTMLEDLSDRSDLVNGNVANIRNDITDLQEDIIELYSAEDIEYEKRDNGRDVEVDPGHGRDPLSARKNKKRLELERRKKRRQIEADRNNQDHPLHGSGRDDRR